MSPKISLELIGQNKANRRTNHHSRIVSYTNQKHITFKIILADHLIPFEYTNKIRNHIFFSCFAYYIYIHFFLITKLAPLTIISINNNYIYYTSVYLMKPNPLDRKEGKEQNQHPQMYI